MPHRIIFISDILHGLYGNVKMFTDKILSNDLIRGRGLDAVRDHGAV